MPVDARLTQGDFVQDGDQVTPQAEDKNHLLEFCKTPRSRDEMQYFMGLTDREHFRLNILQPLLKSGDLLLTIPNKPTSSKQKYYTNPDRYKSK